MKKSYIVGLLSAALVVGGGTGAYISLAKEKVEDQGTTMHQNMNSEQMSKMMESGDMSQMMKDHNNMTLEEMRPYAKEMHPDLSDKELEEMYNSCHGTNGTSDTSL
jgi:hypothetical protein